MYLSSQLFFETPHKTLKFQEPRKVSAATDKKYKHGRVEVSLLYFPVCF